MKHGRIADSSTTHMEPCNCEKLCVGEEQDNSFLQKKAFSRVSAPPISLQHVQSFTTSCVQFSRAINVLADKVTFQFLNIIGAERSMVATSRVNYAPILWSADPDLGALSSSSSRSLSNSKPNFLNTSSVIPSAFSSVRALSSTPASSNGFQDKSVMTPISQEEENLQNAPGASTSFSQFHPMGPGNGMPLPRTNMPLISPIHREGEFICGWGAAFINIWVTFPINKAIFRQQLHGISGRKAIYQLRKDGLQYLYRGLLPPLLQKTMSLSMMFGMYFHCQDVLKEHFPGLGVVPNHAMAAMISGTLEAAFMPFERIQTLMQNREFHNRFANTPDAFRHLWGYGLKEYYRGLSLIIWRNGPSNVVFFLGREHLQTAMPQPDSQSKKMLTDFLSGACLGAMISTAFFPLNVVKTRMQSKLGGPHESGWATLKLLLAERKGRLRELFKGVH
ncbi:hypothetical protein EGW08_017863, partial [Elysia chlorotica]